MQPVSSLVTAGIDTIQQRQIRDNAISARYVSNRGTSLPSQQGIYGRIENTGLARDIYKGSPSKRQMNEFNKNWVKNVTSILKFGDDANL